MDIFDAEEDHTGKIDTQKFARWLRAQCKKLGVRFVFDHNLVSVSTDPDNTIKKVCLMRVMPPGAAPTASFGSRTEGGEVQYLDCHNLVLAAGPWTTGILQDVLFEADKGLPNFVQSAFASFVDVEMATKAVKDDVGLLLPFVAQDDKYIDPRIGMAARVPQKQVAIFGTARQTEDAHLSAEDALNPSLDDTKPFDRICEYAGRRLDPTGGNGRNPFQMEGMRLRFAKVSTAADGLPFVGRLPSSPFEIVNTTGQDGHAGGIWLCFGFGMHGTFLGPGAAHNLVAEMFNDPT